VYLAVERIAGRTRYYIRESYRENEAWKSRDLFCLERHPSTYITYMGEYGYYLNEEVECGVRSDGREIDAHELDRLFRPFLRPGVRDRVERFDRGASGASRKRRGSPSEYSELYRGIHTFDRRRIHYLRLGRMDQGKICLQTHRFFNHLLDKSRDELEQMFLEMESFLRPREYKSYVYVIFDLQRHFPHLMSRFFPASLDQERLDEVFLEDFCALSANKAYRSEHAPEDALNRYLKRYLIMFLDHDYPSNNLEQEFIRAFIENRRLFNPPPPSAGSVTVREAFETMGIGEQEFVSMSVEALTKLYRRKAHERHPDKGGGHDDFVKLEKSYRILLERKKAPRQRRFRRG